MVNVEKIENNSEGKMRHTLDEKYPDKNSKNKKGEVMKKSDRYSMELKGQSLKNCQQINGTEQGFLKNTVGNAERNKENRRQFRCDLRWLSKELECGAAAKYVAYESGCGVKKCYLDE